MPSDRLWREHKEHPSYCTCADCCEARLSGRRKYKPKGRDIDVVKVVLISVATVMIGAMVLAGILDAIR